MSLDQYKDSGFYFQPNLCTEYLEDLDRLFDRIVQSPEREWEGIIKEEIGKIEANSSDRPLEGDEKRVEEYTELVKYVASLEVLLDLIEINHKIQKNPSEIDGFPPVKLFPPNPERFENDPQEYKRIEREILQKERHAQFDKSTRRFIREMEEPHRHNNRSIDVTDLICSGRRLYEDLDPLADLDRSTIIDQIDDVIEPYVQVAEKGVKDPHTGLDLNDIWRYFRYTWLTPYNTVPGRNINFLIRDASREFHPVMGIASLASSMMNLKQRDKHLGWRVDAVSESLDRRYRVHEVEHQLPEDERTDDTKTVTKEITEYLETEEEWNERVDEHCSFIRSAVQNAIEESISNIRHDDFIDRYDDLSKEQFETPTSTTFTRLKQIEGLATYVFKNEPPLVSEVENPEEHENIFDSGEYELSPEDLNDVDFEDTDPDYYERCTLAEIGISKADLEALVLEEQGSEENDETGPLGQRITEIYPESIRLSDFAEIQVDIDKTDLDSFGPVEFDNIDEDSVKLGSYVMFHLKSETALFVKKRAHTLQKLLRDREYFLQHQDQNDDTAFIKDALESSEGKRALQTALKEIKKRRVGAGMMNIQVCGAIPPYNHILGGKLVAMALTGPEVIDAYRNKYEGYRSEIASAMKGEPVIKENELVFLDTTGLFKVGSAQYDRIRIPTPSGKIKYEEIGMTEGYGSVQFGVDTRKRLAEVTELLEDRQVARGRFGEGIAPKMRKIRHGLENLDLNGELLKHESPRVIYAVELAEDFREYLFGLTDDPDYYWPFNDVLAEQQSVFDYWKKRWVSKRIQKQEILGRIEEFDKWTDLALGPELDVKNNHSLDEFY